jgi:8-oxo-dGTP diphosphatase
MDSEVAKIYGQKVRVRICGLCWRDNSLLLVNHTGITDSDFWAPPGGGLEFGESFEECLKKEFLEETGLNVEVGRFRFGCEFIQRPLHSVELFFDVKEISGELIVGTDPEIQIIDNVKYMTMEDIRSIPASGLHGVFKHVDNLADLRQLGGFLRI